MKILDRYIVFSYLKMMLWSLIAATVVFLVVDLVENLDNFIDAEVQIPIILQYYLLYIPYIFYLVFPVAALLATLFSIGALTINNELIAIKVAGISFLRPLKLLLVVTALLSTGAFYVGETLVPTSNRKRMDIERYEVKKLPRENRAKHGRIYVQVGEGQQLYIDNYKSMTREAFKIRLLQVSEGRINMRIDADKMVWRDDQWLVQGAREMVFTPYDQAQEETPVDSSAWQPVTFQEKSDFRISGAGLRPDEFERVLTKPEEMNSAELIEFIDRFKRIGGDTKRWEVDLLSKKAQAASAIIIVLFGAPIAAVKRRGGTALGFGISLFICFIFFGIAQIGKNLGMNGIIEPWFSSWLGNIIFGLVGLVLLLKSNT